MKVADREFIAWWIYDDVERELFSVDFGIRHVRVSMSLMKYFVQDIEVILYDAIPYKREEVHEERKHGSKRYG